MPVNRTTGKKDICADLEGQGVLPEAEVLSGNKASQEDVDALSHTEGHGDDTVCSRLPIQAADEV